MSKDFDRLEACRLYLKDGETPVECIERHRKDIDALLTLPADAKRAAAAERPAPTCATCKHWKEYPAALGVGACAQGVRQDKTGYVWDSFGCTLHEPAAPRSVVAPEKE